MNQNGSLTKKAQRKKMLTGILLVFAGIFFLWPSVIMIKDDASYVLTGKLTELKDLEKKDDWESHYGDYVTYTVYNVLGNYATEQTKLWGIFPTSKEIKYYAAYDEQSNTLISIKVKDETLEKNLSMSYLTGSLEPITVNGQLSATPYDAYELLLDALKYTRTDDVNVSEHVIDTTRSRISVAVDDLFFATIGVLLAVLGLRKLLVWKTEFGKTSAGEESDLHTINIRKQELNLPCHYELYSHFYSSEEEGYRFYMNEKEIGKASEFNPMIANGNCTITLKQSTYSSPYDWRRLIEFVKDQNNPIESIERIVFSENKNPIAKLTFTAHECDLSIGQNQLEGRSGKDGWCFYKDGRHVALLRISDDKTTRDYDEKAYDLFTANDLTEPEISILLAFPKLNMTQYIHSATTTKEE